MYGTTITTYSRIFRVVHRKLTKTDTHVSIMVYANAITTYSRIVRVVYRKTITTYVVLVAYCSVFLSGIGPFNAPKTVDVI